MSLTAWSFTQTKEIAMPCVSDRCQQGRKACPTSLICSQGLHRAHIDTPPASSESTMDTVWSVFAGILLLATTGAFAMFFYQAWPLIQSWL